MRYNFDGDSIFKSYRRILLEQAGPTDQAPMDPKVFKTFEDKLVRAKFRLYKVYPFFGLTLQKLKTVVIKPEEAARYGINTMAVDNSANIYINANFVLNELSDDEVMGVLAHEVMHIATLTFTRQRGRDMTIWNYATDYIMNRDLVDMGISLPKMGLIPQNKNGRWIIEIPDASKAKINTKGKSPSLNVTGIQMKKVDITDMDAEQLYDILIKSGPPEQVKQCIQQVIDQMGELDKHLTPQEAEQIKGEKVPSNDPVYQKNDTSGMSDQQRDNALKSKVQEAAQQAQDEAKRRGTDPGMPRSFDKRLLSAKVNWKQLLKNFIVGSSVVKTDWSRESRRLGGGTYFHPRRYTVKNELQAVVAIDTSGSITDPVLKTFLGGIIDILKVFRNNKVKILVLLWDATVADHFEIDTSKMSMSKITEGLMNMKAHGGGTTLSSVKQFLDKYYQGKPIKGGLLVFTDGYVEDNPILPQAPKKLFFITMDGTDEILKKFGPTYFIDVSHS